MGVAFSPDGTRVMAGDAGISGVKVWDLGPNGDAEWANLPAPGYATAEFMPDGQRVVTSSSGRPEERVGSRGDDLGSAGGHDLRTIGPATDVSFQSSLP